jgi:hypothetical protein
MKRVKLPPSAPAAKLTPIIIHGGAPAESGASIAPAAAAPTEARPASIEPSKSGHPLMEAVVREEQPRPPAGQPLFARSEITQPAAISEVGMLPELPLRDLTQSERDLLHWYCWEPAGGLALKPRPQPPRHSEGLEKAQQLGISVNRFNHIFDLLHPSLKDTKPGPSLK